MVLALGTYGPSNWTQSKRKLIVVEGGGTRGYASLSMLRVLMEQIREIETDKKPHTRLIAYMDNDPDFVANWTPHLSSFGPMLEQLPVTPPLLRNSTKTSQKQMKRKKTGETEEAEDTSRYAKIREKKGRFLPCHYFDYIGGTSTGGFVSFLCAHMPRTPAVGSGPSLCLIMRLIHCVID